MRKQVVGVLLASMLLGHSPASFAASPANESTPEQVAYGAGSALGTMVYVPFKATFCILGGISSAVTFVFAGAQTASEVAAVSCRGTWVITPEILKGEEAVKFVGEVPPADTVAKR